MTDTAFAIPTLTTKRLVLRAPKASDIPAYMAFCASERSQGVGGPFDAEQAFLRISALIGHWHLRGYGRWMLEQRHGGDPLGVVGLMQPPGWPEPELAWTVFDPAEGKGYAQEAARAARRYAYDTLGWTTLISCTMPDNTRSAALAQRLGAVRDADFEHPAHGTLWVWRHPSPEAAA